MRKKEIAKFFAGLTAWEAVVHSSLAACDMLPFTWCKFNITVSAPKTQYFESREFPLT